MTLLPPLESFIPEDHRLRRLNKILDLSFVHEAVQDLYCQDNGRPSIDPEVVLRLFILQALEGITSVRNLMRQVQVNMAYRWFIGYRLDENLPNHSTLSRALDRMGDEVFNELFERSILQCQSSGLIEGKVFHLDATTIRADLDADRVNKPDSPDGDARFGRFPGDQIKPGYKQQTMADGRRRVIIGVSVMPANCPDDTGMMSMVDEVIDRLETVPEALCADTAYSSGKNCASMENRGVRLVSPPRKVKPCPGTNHFTVEDFVYDESNDEFLCPGGQKLKFIGKDSERSDRRMYRAWLSHCRECELKSHCTNAERRRVKVSSNHGALVRLRADSQTESFAELYRMRGAVIEGIFAEGKQWHGLGRAWRRGLSKMRIQSLLIAAVINFKRLAAFFADYFGLNIAFRATIHTILGLIYRFWRPIMHHDANMDILCCTL